MASRIVATGPPHFLHFVRSTPRAGSLIAAWMVPLRWFKIFSVTISLTRAMFRILRFLVPQIHSTFEVVGLPFM